MSAPEITEQKSSIKLTRNAKGDVQPEVKVYEGTDAGELDRIRELAVAQYTALVREFGGVS